MSNRELVLELAQELPEDTPLLDFARRLEYISGIQQALDEADRGEGVPIQEARALVSKWASQ